MNKHKSKKIEEIEDIEQLYGKNIVQTLGRGGFGALEEMFNFKTLEFEAVKTLQK